MKNMKVMKIIHESVNERANGRVHSLTPVLPLCPPCSLWLRNVFFCVLLCVLWTIIGFLFMAEEV